MNAARAAIAIELVNEQKKSNKDVSVALGITPSAISQYVKGKRGSSLRKNMGKLQEFEKSVKDTAITIARLMEINEYDRCQGTILKIAQELAGISSEGNKTGNVSKEGYPNIRIKATLAERIKRDHGSAVFFLGFAQNTNNYFARVLFRQIATDSLRHADILQTLLEMVDKPPITESRKISMEMVDKLLEKEREENEIPINGIKKRLGPEADLLIESIEMDHKEHMILLRKFRDLMK